LLKNLIRKKNTKILRKVKKMVFNRKIANLSSQIQVVDIGLDENTDLFRWMGHNGTVFRLDINSTRKIAQENFYLHLERTDRRMVFISKNNIKFLIISDNSVQFQLLEAYMEEIIDRFFNSYKEICQNPVLLRSMSNAFGGFAVLLPKIFEDACKNRIKGIVAYCAICKRKHDVIVRKTLITEADHHPVSLVFEHQGHGLLIYIDSHFRVRGQEVVQITG